MSVKELIKQLLLIEERISKYYIALAEIVMGVSCNPDYEYYFKMLCDAIEEEKNILNQISMQDGLGRLNQLVSEELRGVKEFDITLGRHTKEVYFRLKYILEYISGDEVLEYVNVLRYDANKVKLMMLGYLKTNPEYESIMNELIASEYNMYFLNPDSEADFTNCLEKDMILKADSCRTEDFPGSKYIDRGVLLYESSEALNYIISNSIEDFKDNKNLFTSIVLKLLTIFANMILCEEENLGEMNEEIAGLLESSSYSPELKELIECMIEVLNELKSEIRYER